MEAIDNRIFELVNQGNKAKAIAETLKAEGLKTSRGKTPDYVYVRNKLSAIRAKGGLKAFSRRYSKETSGVNGDATTLLRAILNSGSCSNEKKVAVLKAWFS